MLLFVHIQKLSLNPKGKWPNFLLLFICGGIDLLACYEVKNSRGKFNSEFNYLRLPNPHFLWSGPFIAETVANFGGILKMLLLRISASSLELPLATCDHRHLHLWLNLILRRKFFTSVPICSAFAPSLHPLRGQRFQACLPHECRGSPLCLRCVLRQL